AVLEKIQAKTRSQIVYPGLKDFKEDPGLAEIDPFKIPGIGKKQELVPSSVVGERSMYIY
ncbi:hypothetical protein EV181_007706, partial [Coemansia sp. RSA 532]